MLCCFREKFKVGPQSFRLARKVSGWPALFCPLRNFSICDSRKSIPEIARRHRSISYQSSRLIDGLGQIAYRYENCRTNIQIARDCWATFLMIDRKSLRLARKVSGWPAKFQVGPHSRFATIDPEIARRSRSISYQSSRLIDGLGQIVYRYENCRTNIQIAREILGNIFG